MIMTIRLEDLIVSTIIGYYDWERTKRQTLVINVEFDIDGTKPAETDNLEDTVDYKTIKNGILDLAESSEFVLIEKLAKKILDYVLGDSKILRAKVRIDKPHALRFVKTVSVEVMGEN